MFFLFYDWVMKINQARYGSTQNVLVKIKSPKSRFLVMLQFLGLNIINKLNCQAFIFLQSAIIPSTPDQVNSTKKAVSIATFRKSRFYRTFSKWGQKSEYPPHTVP